MGGVEPTHPTASTTTPPEEIRRRTLEHLCAQHHLAAPWTCSPKREPAEGNPDLEEHELVAPTTEPPRGCSSCTKVLPSVGCREAHHQPGGGRLGYSSARQEPLEESGISRPISRSSMGIGQATVTGQPGTNAGEGTTCSEGGAGRHRICHPDRREPAGQLNPEAAADDPTHQPHACAGEKTYPTTHLTVRAYQRATIHATCSQRICPFASSSPHVSSLGAVGRGKSTSTSSISAQFRKLLRTYALDDRRAMNLTLTFTSAALLGGLLGALANYAPPLPRQRPVGTSDGTTLRPLEHHPRGGPGEHYDDVKDIEEADQEFHERMEGHHNQLLTQDPYEPYHTKVATRERGGVREVRGQPAPRAQRGQSEAPAPQTTSTSSTRTRPSTTSRTSRGSMTTTRSSPTTLAQQGGATHKNHGASEGDEISWMAVSNNNPPTRGTTRLGPPTTTTTSVPPPPPPMFQDEDTPLPPPLQPDMLLSMGYPQGTTWVLEEGVWQNLPGRSAGGPYIPSDLLATIPQRLVHFCSRGLRPHGEC